MTKRPNPSRRDLEQSQTAWDHFGRWQSTKGKGYFLLYPLLDICERELYPAYLLRNLVFWVTPEPLSKKHLTAKPSTVIKTDKDYADNLHITPRDIRSSRSYLVQSGYVHTFVAKTAFYRNGDQPLNALHYVVLADPILTALARVLPSWETAWERIRPEIGGLKNCATGNMLETPDLSIAGGANVESGISKYSVLTPPERSKESKQRWAYESDWSNSLSPDEEGQGIEDNELNVTEVDQGGSPCKQINRGLSSRIATARIRSVTLPPSHSSGRRELVQQQYERNANVERARAFSYTQRLENAPHGQAAVPREQTPNEQYFRDHDPLELIRRIRAAENTDKVSLVDKSTQATEFP